MVALFEFIVVLVALLIGTYTDIKWREVPDFLNFSLIAVGFGIAITKSIIILSWLPILYAVIGFGLAFAIALVMFYTGQWGGGDAKMLMGIGAVFGAVLSFNDFLISFMINTIVIGAIYGLLWGLALGFINRKEMMAEMKTILSTPTMRKIRIAAMILAILLLILIFALPMLDGLRLPLIVMVALLFFTLYLWVFVKAVEKVCMVKKVSPKELTEGDWILKDIIVKNDKKISILNYFYEKEEIKNLSGIYLISRVIFLNQFLKNEKKTYFYFLKSYFSNNYDFIEKFQTEFKEYQLKKLNVDLKRSIQGKLIKESIINSFSPNNYSKVLFRLFYEIYFYLSLLSGFNKENMRKLEKALTNSNLTNIKLILNDNKLLRGLITSAEEYGYFIKENKLLIAGKRDLGVSKEQIELLKKMKLKTVTIKTGIPFVPSFLLALITTYFSGNLFLFLII